MRLDPTTDDPLTLGKLMEINAFQHEERIQEISGQASSEASLEGILKRVMLLTDSRQCSQISLSPSGGRLVESRRISRHLLQGLQRRLHSRRHRRHHSTARRCEHQHRHHLQFTARRSYTATCRRLASESRSIQQDARCLVEMSEDLAVSRVDLRRARHSTAIACRGENVQSSGQKFQGRDEKNEQDSLGYQSRNTARFVQHRARPDESMPTLQATWNCFKRTMRCSNKFNMHSPRTSKRSVRTFHGT